LKIVAVKAVWGDPSQFDIAARVFENFLSWRDSYGRPSKIASGNTQFAARLRALKGP